MATPGQFLSPRFDVRTWNDRDLHPLPSPLVVIRLRLSAGPRQQVVAELTKKGALLQDGTVRLQVTERGGDFPTTEEMLVAAFAVVIDKCRPGFDRN